MLQVKEGPKSLKLKFFHEAQGAWKRNQFQLELPSLHSRDGRLKFTFLIENLFSPWVKRSACFSLAWPSSPWAKSGLAKQDLWAKPNPPPALVRKVLLEQSFVYLFSRPSGGGRVDASEGVWPAKLKIFIIWPFAEKPCQPLHQTVPDSLTSSKF